MPSSCSPVLSSPTVRVYCLPFAGGSANSFSTYKAHSAAGFDFWALELPGRGERSAEPLLTSMEAVLNDYWQHLVPALTASAAPYVLWGHSMGAAVSSWLTVRLHQHGLPLPMLLLHTSKVASQRSNSLALHQLPDSEFVRELRHLGGLPAVLTDGSALLQHCLPIIRADIQAIESCTQPTPVGLPVPIRIIVSRSERPAPAERQRWELESAREVTYKEVPGDHFFIYQSRRIVEEELRRALAAQLPSIN